MKLATLGGCGVRSPLLVKSLAVSAKAVGIDTLMFMDNGKEKLDIFGSILNQVVSALVLPSVLRSHRVPKRLSKELTISSPL